MTKKDDHEKREPNVEVDDYTSLREGDRDPSLNRTVSWLIVSDTSFIVYLDEEMFVEWSTNKDYGKFAEDFGSILNRVGYLEAVAKEILPDKKRPTYQRLLGESVGRVLDDRKSTAASEILDRAESLITGPARFRYVLGAAGVVLVSTLIGLLEWVGRVECRKVLGDAAFDLLLTGHFGCLGAFLSILLRSATVEVDPTADGWRHYAEGGLRTVAGFLSGVLAAIAIKANVVLGFVRDVGGGFPLFALVGMAAGISERIVPALVRRVDDAFLNEGHGK